MSPKILNIFLIISSFVIYFYIAKPLYSGSNSFLISPGNDVKSLISKRADYDKTIDAVSDVFKQSDAAKKQYESLSDADKKNILTMVPVSVNEIKLMAEITNLATLSGIKMEGMGIKDKGVNKKENFGEYIVSFNFLDTYSNFKKSMTVWENSMRLFKVDAITFTPAATEDEVTKFNVSLSTYYMK